MRANRTCNWILLLTALSSCATAPQRESAPNAPVPADSASPAPAPVATSPAPADAPLCERPPRPLTEDGVFYVQSSEPASPRVRYLDGQVSLNDSCAIRRGSKLNRRVPPIYVNGKPIGFC